MRHCLIAAVLAIVTSAGFAGEGKMKWVADACFRHEDAATLGAETGMAYKMLREVLVEKQRCGRVAYRSFEDWENARVDPDGVRVIMAQRTRGPDALKIDEPKQLYFPNQPVTE